MPNIVAVKVCWVMGKPHGNEIHGIHLDMRCQFGAYGYLCSDGLFGVQPLTVVDRREIKAHVPDDVALLDLDKISFPLTLRRWREGDSFIPFGFNGRKKVSDYLIDHKVSMAEKARQFVLLSADNIAWLVGRRTGDEFRITDKSDKVLRITRENIY